jgi:threonyl-tRNA synthetase
VRDRLDGDLGAFPLAEAIAKLRAEVEAKTVRQVADGGAPPPPFDRGTNNEY